jgi:malate synthase
VSLDTGEKVTHELVRQYEKEELEKIREQVGDEFFYSEGRPDESRELFDQVALSDEFVDFLTLPAYERLED